MGTLRSSEYPSLRQAVGAISPGDRLLISSGEHRIDQPLRMPSCSGWSIEADGRATIEQQTDGCPILQFARDNVHSWTIRGLRLRWRTHQDRLGADGIQFTLDAGSVNGFYRGLIDDCEISGGFRGIAIDRASGNDIPVWSTTVQRTWIRGSRSAAIFLSGNSVGMPENALRDVYVQQKAGAASEAEPRYRPNVEQQVVLTAQQISISNLGLEGSAGPILRASNARIDAGGLHVEHVQIEENGDAWPDLFWIGGGQLELTNLHLAGRIDVAGRGYATILNGAQGAQIAVRGVNDELEGTAPLRIFDGRDARYVAGNVRTRNGVIPSDLDDRIRRTGWIEGP